MSRFKDYKDRFNFIKMERQDGILQMTLHSKDGELLWGGRPHEELSYAFGEVTRDHDNRAVIITGTGNSFCADIISGRTDPNRTATAISAMSARNICYSISTNLRSGSIIGTTLIFSTRS